MQNYNTYGLQDRKLSAQSYRNILPVTSNTENMLTLRRGSEQTLHTNYTNRLPQVSPQTLTTIQNYHLSPQQHVPVSRYREISPKPNNLTFDHNYHRSTSRTSSHQLDFRSNSTQKRRLEPSPRPNVTSNLIRTQNNRLYSNQTYLQPAYTVQKDVSGQKRITVNVNQN
jgi:hypothetical protein